MRAEEECQAGRMTAVRRNVVGLWLMVCEGYVAEHELEARRGWNALDLLRSVHRYLEDLEEYVLAGAMA